MLKLIATLAKFQAASLLYLLQEVECLRKGARGGISASLESEEKVVRGLIEILEGNLDADKKELLGQLAGIQNNVQTRVEKTAKNLNLKEYPGKLYENLSPAGLIGGLNKNLHDLLQKLGDLTAQENEQGQPQSPAPAPEAKNPEKGAA